VRYLPLLERLDQWQAAARAAHPGIVPCAPGCAQCCRGPFDISVADAELVMEAVRALDPARRREVVDRARDSIRRMRNLVSEWREPFAIDAIGDQEFDRVSEALADLPCPLLDDGGRCLGYANRPLVCRMIGLGMVTESGFVIENACPIQDRFPEYAALPPAEFPLESTEADEDRANETAAERVFGDPRMAQFETTVAGAVLLITHSPDRP
jgi:Fe-S-cluster containining protein